jgi:hypothetical protein
MTSDKAQRDSLNNERFQDIYIHASQKPWIQFYPGVGFKLLRATHPPERRASSAPDQRDSGSGADRRR